MKNATPTLAAELRALPDLQPSQDRFREVMVALEQSRQHRPRKHTLALLASAACLLIALSAALVVVSPPRIEPAERSDTGLVLQQQSAVLSNIIAAQATQTPPLTGASAARLDVLRLALAQIDRSIADDLATADAHALLRRRIDVQQQLINAQAQPAVFQL